MAVKNMKHLGGSEGIRGSGPVQYYQDVFLKYLKIVISDYSAL